MRKELWILFMLVLSASTFAQKTITLRECYEKAYSSVSFADEKRLLSEIWQLKDKNLSKNWLPGMDINGAFLYNSSVVDMTGVLGSLPFPGIGDFIRPLPNEQYKVTLDINQTLFDGGAVKASRALEKIEYDIQEMQTEKDLYQLRTRINSIYFNLLLLDKQEELLQNYLKLINKRIITVNSGVTSGVALKSDKDVLLSEKIKFEQQLRENEINKTLLQKILSGFIGTTIEASDKFALPAPIHVFHDSITRPELQLFDLRKEQLNVSMQMLESKRLPKAFTFATFGYGNPPGANFFKDEFAPYYIFGAGVKWNIHDWNRVRNEKQILNLQQNVLSNRKVDMTENFRRLLDEKRSLITSLESLLETDEELIGIRKRITLAAESQYENGTITVTEYMNELNSEKQAMINFEIHKINLVMARVEYLNIIGREIE